MASPPVGRLPREVAGFRLLPSSHKEAFSPHLGPVAGGLAEHFAERGVMAAERATYAHKGGRIEVLLLEFSDRRRAKEYYLFWRAIEMLRGPVRDLKVAGADACTLSIGSGEWALLVGRSLASLEPSGVRVPPDFLERMAAALKVPSPPPAVEIKLPLRASKRGRLFVALRDLAEAIRAPLAYDERRGEALLRIGTLILAFKPGRPEVVAGDSYLALPSPPAVIGGRICLPLESVEALTGAKVEVDEKGGTVKLTFPPSPAAPHGGGCRAPGCIAPKGASEGAGDRVP